MKHPCLVLLASTATSLLLSACQLTTPSGSATQVTSFTAYGNEPFWTVKTHGATLTKITPENPQGQQLTAQPSVYANGVSFTGDQGNQTFILDIKEVACIDSMSGQHFPYTATWKQSGETHAGCAERSREASSADAEQRSEPVKKPL